MRTTAAALRELQEYFAALDPKPNIREIAKLSHMSYSTAARYLNGTTKQGLPDNVRALARALGREDIMDEVVAETPTRNADAWWIFELQREMREDNLEELERERALRKETEQRFERMIASKDESIRRLSDRIEKLEAEKGELAAEKSELATDLKSVRRRKRIYEVLIVGLFVVMALYFIIFDLPYPDYGITEVLLDLMKK